MLLQLNLSFTNAELHFFFEAGFYLICLLRYLFFSSWIQSLFQSSFPYHGRGFGSEKTNSLFNLTIHQPDIHKIYFYAKDSFEVKYHLVINKKESTGLKHFNDSKALIEYSGDMDVIYKKIEEYNPNQKRKMLIVFYDMIADMPNNKNLNPVVTELFIRGRKLNTSLVFITQSYFAVTKILD